MEFATGTQLLKLWNGEADRNDGSSASDFREAKQ